MERTGTCFWSRIAFSTWQASLPPLSGPAHRTVMAGRGLAGLWLRRELLTVWRTCLHLAGSNKSNRTSLSTAGRRPSREQEVRAQQNRSSRLLEQYPAGVREWLTFLHPAPSTHNAVGFRWDVLIRQRQTYWLDSSSCWKNTYQWLKAIVRVCRCGFVWGSYPWSVYHLTARPPCGEAARCTNREADCRTPKFLPPKRRHTYRICYLLSVHYILRQLCLCVGVWTLYNWGNVEGNGCLTAM